VTPLPSPHCFFFSLTPLSPYTIFGSYRQGIILPLNYFFSFLFEKTFTVDLPVCLRYSTSVVHHLITFFFFMCFIIFHVRRTMKYFDLCFLNIKCIAFVLSSYLFYLLFLLFTFIYYGTWWDRSTFVLISHLFSFTGDIILYA